MVPPPLLSWDTAYLLEVLGGHLGEDAIEVPLVGLVDESVVEHPLALVAVEPEDVVVLTDHTRVSLQHSCITRGEQINGA